MKPVIFYLLLMIFASFNLPLKAQYYHTFQNFDDDVDRIKTYSNLWGGNYGTVNVEQFRLSKDTLNTRSSSGRCLKIEYGPLNNWSMYVESLERKWADNNTFMNLLDLFPDYTDQQFKNRKIDSLVFYAKLVSANALTLKVEFHDSMNRSSSQSVDIPASSKWTRVSMPIPHIVNQFDPAFAKYFGFTLADYPGNWGETGSLFLDDMYMVENNYSKPEFTNDDDFLKYINMVSFRHFWMAVDSASQFALDRHPWTDLVSVDAIGFQLSAYAVAHKNNWVDRSKIEKRVEKILYNLLYICQHAVNEEQVQANPLRYASVKGTWAHFLDYKTRARKDISTEFSLFTNALLIPGFIVTNRYFHDNDSIVSMSEKLIRLTDWKFLYRSQDNTMYYSWSPENGFSVNTTDYFTEELDLAFLLGISAPGETFRLPANPFLSTQYMKELSDKGFINSYPGANFTYYFLQQYAPYNINSCRFENGKRALLRDLAYSNEVFVPKGYDSRVFGITACEGPDSAGVSVTGTNISNYHAYGYPPKKDNANDPNGTYAIYGAGASMLHIPDKAIACLKYYYTDLDAEIRNKSRREFWSPVWGFPDAFNLFPDESSDPEINRLKFRGPWVSVPRFGIDVGPMLINIDSYLAEKGVQPSVRTLFASYPGISVKLPQFNYCVTNIADASKSFYNSNSLDIFPNPSHDRFYINPDETVTGKGTVSVFTLDGKLVYQKVVDLGAGKPLEITHNLKSGLYQVEIKNDTGRQFQKIVITDR